MINYLGYQILEMHLGQFPDSMEFRSWKVDFKTEVCSKSAFLHLTMHRIKEVETEKSIDDLFTSVCAKTAHPQLTVQWIKEIEIARSVDELVTPRSVLARTDSPDYDMLDAMIASAFEKLSISARISEREVDCLYDLRAFSCNRSI